MSVNPFLAETLLRTQSSIFGLGVDVTREQREEERLENERQRRLETRESKRSGVRLVGRTVGGILGFLTGTGAIGAGVGSAIGQGLATSFAPGTNPKFKRIAPGRYFVDLGRERETQFRSDERIRHRNLNAQILASAISDAFTGGRIKSLEGRGGILDLILGREQDMPGTVLPTTGGAGTPSPYFT